MRDTAKCACGRKIPQRYGSTIQNKQCPSCTLLNLSSGDTNKVKRGLKQKIANTTVKKRKSVKTSKNTKKSIVKKLDIAWSKLVKIKGDHKCAVCGKTKSLNSHHITSRANHSIRWNLDNGICLCVGHHIGVTFSAHKTPIKFIYWLEDRMGKEFLNKLIMKGNSTYHYHLFELEVMLKELNNEIVNHGKVQ